jgi:hypothetical protein
MSVVLANCWTVAGIKRRLWLGSRLIASATAEAFDE